MKKFADHGHKLSPGREKDFRHALARMEFEKPRALPDEIQLIHGSWHVARTATRELLARAKIPQKRLERWDTCGSLAFVERHVRTREYRVRCVRCKDRFCRTCATRKRRQQIDRLMGLLRDWSGVKMLTLTLKHSSEPLKIQLDRLYACYRRLRQREAWKTHVKAGAAACEIKLGKDGLWHVHLHVLLVGSFWHQREISHEWLAVTGDSTIVDIRPMPSDRAVNYATKYLSKAVPSDMITSPTEFIEAIHALHGRRLLIVSGAWVGQLSEKSEENPAEIEEGSTSEKTRKIEPKTWIGVGNYTTLLARANAGCVLSRRIIRAIHDKFKKNRDDNPPGRRGIDKLVRRLSPEI